MNGYYSINFLAIWSQSDQLGLEDSANSWLTRVLFISARALSERCFAAIQLSTSGRQWSGMTIPPAADEWEAPVDGVCTFWEAENTEANEVAGVCIDDIDWG